MTTSPDTSRAAALLGRPFSLGSLELRNRVVMAPMTRNFSPNGVPGADVAEYYARRAAGGTGLLVTEGTYIGRDAAAAYPRVPHFHGEESLAGWARVAERVHQEGGRIFPQLWHTGPARNAKSLPLGLPAEGPSGLALDGSAHGVEMSLADIDAVVAAFAQAAADAERAGFDGVELHGAHGYLIDTFLWGGTNRRTDGYGGSPAARARFAAEVVAAVRGAVSADFPVALRMSQWKADQYDARIAETPEELEAVLTPLANAGVDLFHASTRRYWLPEFDGSELNLAGWVKKITGKAVVTVGSVGLDKEFTGPQGFAPTAAGTGIDLLLDRLERDEFDLVAVGRALIGDPEWTAKALGDRLDDVVPYQAESLAQLV